MNEFINCSLCNYKSTGLQLLSSWRDKVETHKVPVVLPNLVKAIFVHTSSTSSLFLSESLGAIFFLQLCFPCCFYQDGWSIAIKVLPSVWDSEFLITCFVPFSSDFPSAYSSQSHYLKYASGFCVEGLLVQLYKAVWIFFTIK